MFIVEAKRISNSFCPTPIPRCVPRVVSPSCSANLQTKISRSGSDVRLCCLSRQTDSNRGIDAQTLTRRTIAHAYETTRENLLVVFLELSSASVRRMVCEHALARCRGYCTATVLW